MTTYVDDMMAPFGRLLLNHMVADSDEELHAMADAIGVDRKWHQGPPKASSSHYDVSKGYARKGDRPRGRANNLARSEFDDLRKEMQRPGSALAFGEGR